MVTRRPWRVLIVLLPLFAAMACGGQIPYGWHVIDANDIERTRLLRAISCGAAVEVGLIIDQGALSAEDKRVIDGLAVTRRAADARILRPDAQTLAAIYVMTGVTVLIGDKTARSWSPLVPDKLLSAAKPVAVILDLPMANFAAHLAVLAKQLSGDAGAGWRAIATTAQVSATLTPESLRRLETLASVCAIYPDAMHKPAE